MIRVMKAMLVAYAAGLVVAAFVGVWTATSRTAAADEKKVPEYIGAKKCKKCHLKQYKSWAKTPMAGAFESLKPDVKVDVKTAAKLDPKKDYTKDATCLKCHTTGYGTPTGYPAVVKDKAWTDAETLRAGKLEGLGCETCHGPGSLYSPLMKANKKYKRAEIIALGAHSPPKAEQCLVCHEKDCPTMGKDYKFDFAKACESEKTHKHKKLKYEH